MQVPDDRAREMTEAFIRDPRGSHAKHASQASEPASMNGATRLPAKNGGRATAPAKAKAAKSKRRRKAAAR